MSTRTAACFVVDRLKELIICSGFNVYPRVVEEAIYAHPDVVEAAVCGVPDSYRGETVKAFVVARDRAQPGRSGAARLPRGRLSPIEMPKLIEFRDELPKSAVGKILKRELLHAQPAADAMPPSRIGVLTAAADAPCSAFVAPARIQAVATQYTALPDTACPPGLAARGLPNGARWRARRTAAAAPG